MAFTLCKIKLKNDIFTTVYELEKRGDDEVKALFLKGFMLF